jgi:hypothetical protein
MICGWRQTVKIGCHVNMTFVFIRIVTQNWNYRNASLLYFTLICNWRLAPRLAIDGQMCSYITAFIDFYMQITSVKFLLMYEILRSAALSLYSIHCYWSLNRQRWQQYRTVRSTFWREDCSLHVRRENFCLCLVRYLSRNFEIHNA